VNTEVSYLTETAAFWILGGYAAVIVALAAAVLRIRDVQTKNQVAIDLFIDSLGDKLARALHNDDDHLKIDELLDKYISKTYDMDFEEWQELRFRCLHILEDKDISKNERSLAGMLAAVCEHKLVSRYGKITDRSLVKEVDKAVTEKKD
jgi:hypothetical protein